MRGIASYPNRLKADVEGDLEDIDGVMKISNIRVHYKIKIPSGKQPEAERALEVHERACPAAMSVRESIGITWSAEFEEVAEE